MHKPHAFIIATMILAVLAGGVALTRADPSGDAAGESPDAGVSPPEATPPSGEVDIATLQREYRELREALFQSRAKASAVASALYSTRMAIELQYATARFYAIDRAVIRLDGATVFEDTAGKIAEVGPPRFEGFVAPGRHVVTIRIEVTGVDDSRFTSVIENSFVVMAPEASDVVVKARAQDEGDMAYAWKKDRRGAYELSLDVSVEATARKQAK